MSGEAQHTLSFEKETSRIETFSDSVFAIAITLLGLNVAVSSGIEASKLADALLRHWPSYLAFLMSFITILIMWVNHHAMFKLVQRTNTLFLFANGFLLLLVTAVPFPTVLVAQYLTTSAASLVSALYASFFFVMNLASNLLWWSAAYRRHLLKPDVTSSTMKRFTFVYLAGFPCYLGATFLTLWNAYAGLSICCTLWVAWSIATHLS